MYNLAYSTMAKDTVNIIENGRYFLNGKKYDIAEDIASAYKGSVLYFEDLNPFVKKFESSKNLRTFKDSKIEITRETTMGAADRLSYSDDKIAILNFASATRPGGGFLKGASAQEESIARVSALVKCLEKFQDSFYNFHKMNNTPYYSNKIIYSPGVPVIKDENGRLLTEPYLIDVITSAAVNCSAIPYNGKVKSYIHNVMYGRIKQILCIAAINRVDTLVLGAFGCGVFKNNVSDIAGIFQHILIQENYKKYFKHITFAITDGNMSKNYDAFVSAFDDSKEGC